MKILTRKLVQELGLDKIKVITAEMFPVDITYIGVYAFAGCSRLTSIDIPNSVTRIEYAAFEGCINLTSVAIPNSIRSIGVLAFYGCSGLTSPVYNAHVFAYMPTSYSGAYTIPNGIEAIAGGAFYGCSGLTSVTIPNSVTSIGYRAFDGCTGLTSVTIGNSVTSIGNAAFYGCSGLTSVSIGDKECKTQKVKDGKCKAYKAFNSDMTCRSFQYEEGKTYELDNKPILCEQGFHACLSLADVFNYYSGKTGKDIVVHEVELEGVSDERNNDSKVVAKKIIIGKCIL